MAATNRPEVLDPAILRPGRFDTRKVKVEEGVDYKEIAARTPLFSGADLANLVNESALLAVRKGLLKVTRECFEEAIDRVIAGLATKSRILPESEKRTVAIHEIGHALVAHASGSQDRVHRISIIPRSSGALGFTMHIPEEERHLMTEKQLLIKVRVLLGGRAAEKVFVGEVTTGAQDDLKRASEIIRRMISEFGMSKSLGLVSLGTKNESYAGNPFVKNEYTSVSEKMSELLDSEMKRTLEDEFAHAVALLEKNKSLVEAMLKVLLEKETIEHEEISEFFKSAVV